MRQAFRFQLMRSGRNRHLDRQINICAGIWNHAVAVKNRYYRMFGKGLPKYRLQAHLAKLRRHHPDFAHWKWVGSQTVQDINLRLHKGWDAFFAGNIKRPPTFRKAKKYTSLTLTQAGWKLEGKGRIRIFDRVYRFHQSRAILGNIKTVTISRDKTGRLYVSFSCDGVPMPEAKPKTGESAGCDFGLKTFLTLSNGDKVVATQPFRHALRQVRLASRNHSRKQKGSESRQRARLDLARVHRKLANQRKAWHWKTATDLVNAYDALAFETLNIKAMKALWGRKVSDLGFSDFLIKQEWLAKKYGRDFVKTPQFEPTTKRMSCCGHIQIVDLDERIVKCETCGTTHDRDVNAAINIKELGRQLWTGVGSKTYV